MSNTSVKMKIVDHNAETQEIEFGLHTYKAAASVGKNVSQYLNDMIPTNASFRKPGEAPSGLDAMSPVEQMMHQLRIKTKPDAATGERATTMDELMSTDPLTTSDQGVIPGIARRLLAPEVILQLANINLQENPDVLMAAWESMIGSTTSVNQKQVGQALMNEVNSQSPGLIQPSHIGQLQLPETMITYTLGERQLNIPTRSVGLMFSNDVLKYSLLDRIGLTMAQNFRAFAINRFYEDMASIISGDAQAGNAAVPFVNASTFDAAVNSTDKKLTHRAWVKWLLQDATKFTKTHVIGSADAWLDYQVRSGLPTVFGDVSTDSNRLPAPAAMVGMAIPTPTFIAMDLSAIGADRLVALDRSRALRKLVNIAADYTAVEQLVLRGGVGMRFDTGVMLVQDNPNVITGLTIGA